ncbi:hypothetical protein quinque_014256 [Culex quinquefasciatus]
MSSLVRALSWPLLSQNQGACAGPGGSTDGGQDDLNGVGGGGGGGVHGNHCKKGGGGGGGMPPSPTFQQLMAARRLLCRRYYPEGGWGWIVIVVGIMVNTMTHGTQLSSGLLLGYVMRYFGKPYTDTVYQINQNQGESRQNLNGFNWEDS